VGMFDRILEESLANGSIAKSAPAAVPKETSSSAASRPARADVSAWTGKGVERESKFSLQRARKGWGRGPVKDSADLKRILLLPRRPPVELGGRDEKGVVQPPSAKAEALIDMMTERLGRGERRCACKYGRHLRRLNGAQAWALYEAPLVGGILGNLGVGSGKCLAAGSEYFDVSAGVRRDVQERVAYLEVPSVFIGALRTASGSAFPSGRKACTKIVIKDGSELVASNDHKILTQRGWVPASELREKQDFVAVPTRMPEPNECTQISDDEVALIALLMSDGSLSGPTQVGFTNATPKVIKEFQRLAIAVCGGWSEDRSRSRAREFNLLGNKSFRTKWSLFGLAKEKRLHPALWGMSAEQAALFINRFWACDGHVSKLALELTLASEKLLDDIRFLLLRLGVRSRKKYKKASFDGKQFDAWRICISGAGAQRFLTEVGDVLGKEVACRRLRRKLARTKRNTNFDVVPVSRQELSEICDELGFFPGSGKRFRSKARAFLSCTYGQYVSREKFKAFCDQYAYRGKYAELLIDGVAWERVAKIEAAGTRPVYDLTVPGPHNFVANGMVVHNTWLDILMPMVMPDCKQAVVLIPPGLKQQLWDEYEALNEHFHVPSIVFDDQAHQRGKIIPGRPVLHVLPYSKLSRPESTDILSKLNPDLIIADECFPVGTRVLTDCGPEPIERVQIGAKVLSYNPSSATFEWKSVLHRFEKSRSVRRMVRVHHANGSFVCTDNHKIWTEDKGYVEAGRLAQGDRLRVVRQSDVSTSEHVGQALLFEEVQRRGQAGQVGSGALRGRWQHAQDQEVEVLGSPEGVSSFVSRADRVEVLERGSDERGGSSSRDDLLYDLEVEGNHNYVAEGVLVSNCQKLCDMKTSTVARFLRFLNGRPDTRFCGWSGTITKKTIKNYAHLLAIALAEGSPLPLEPQVVEEWASAIDPSDCPAPAGALQALSSSPEEGLYGGYHRRLVETLGVVTTKASAVDASINIYERKDPGMPAKIKAMLDNVRQTKTRPDGEEFVDEFETAKCASEIACGFYYRWRFAKGTQDKDIDRWFEARQAWNRELREMLANQEEHLDSPKLCFNAAERYYNGYKGDLPVWNSMTWREWAEVKDTIKYRVVPEWIDDYLAEDCAAWAEKHKGIIWYGHGALGQRIAEISGLPLHGGGPGAEARILSEKGDRSLVVSIKAHGTGRNGLQRMFYEQLFANFPASGDLAEQALGRLHRLGQESDEVCSWVYRHTIEMSRNVDRAILQAKYIQGTLGSRQKLLAANYNFDVDIEAMNTVEYQDEFEE
jgi:intein/homing endonuclease